jgi:hypothetical protein
VALFKSILLLQNDLQNTQTLQLNQIGNYLQKLLEPSEEALIWIDREYNEEKRKRFNLERVD